MSDRHATPPPARKAYREFGASVRMPALPPPIEPSDAVLDEYYAGKRERDIDRLAQLALKDIERDLRSFAATVPPPRRAARSQSDE